MAEIGFSQVKKRYGGTQVLHGIDMQIADGDDARRRRFNGCTGHSEHQGEPERQRFGVFR